MIREIRLLIVLQLLHLVVSVLPKDEHETLLLLREVTATLGEPKNR